ncbi:sulfur carrier protein ThiS [Streptomyces sp. CMB-StM0423]|uniref:sulfur carrier protein ThiS n=1 Tax=Streptomyces sp. CMB-StM0423 TaxID=2059884 RepID=UPI000C704692|nr:sulfur carrier protein ThiS [Streptomyces sp. CMB-StM0423]AUH43493.1 thiamine biosynthesis protein ThiS [Streptomyces sp. CMB-StM0423]
MTEDATQTRTEARTDAPADAPTITVNGAPRAIAAGLTLGALVATLTAAHRGVAAAVNEDVVPRGDWPTTTLGDGDRVEILTAVQGG